MSKVGTMYIMIMTIKMGGLTTIFATFVKIK